MPTPVAGNAGLDRKWIPQILPSNDSATKSHLEKVEPTIAVDPRLPGQANFTNSAETADHGNCPFFHLLCGSPKYETGAIARIRISKGWRTCCNAWLQTGNERRADLWPSRCLDLLRCQPQWQTSQALQFGLGCVGKLEVHRKNYLSNA